MTQREEDLKVVAIRLGQGLITLLSPEDEDLTQHNWYLGSYRYAQMHKGKVPLYLHRMVLTRMLGREMVEGETCDHINGNTLDNRRINLRLASRSENQWNRKPRYDSKSGINGVTKTSNGRWRARINYKGKTITLGHFIEQADAIQARKTAELELFGQFSPLICRDFETS